MNEEMPERCGCEIKWNELAPTDHLLHVYETEEDFLKSLEAFAEAGLTKGEAVIVIATPEHRRALAERLQSRGVDLTTAIAEDRYLEIDAEKLLSSFMFRGWPNDELFKQALSPLLLRAEKGGRAVRKFGEMPSLLMAEGYHGAAVYLENLWRHYARNRRLSQYCAYPRSVFPEYGEATLREISDVHSRVFS
jgi:hypothetical protein